MPDDLLVVLDAEVARYYELIRERMRNDATILTVIEALLNLVTLPLVDCRDVTDWWGVGESVRLAGVLPPADTGRDDAIPLPPDTWHPEVDESRWAEYNRKMGALLGGAKGGSR